jgi:hypothetical protein
MQRRLDFEKWDIVIVFRTPVTVPIVTMHHHIRIIIIKIVATAAIYIFPAFFPSRLYLFTAMNPRAQFEAYRSDEAWKTIMRRRPLRSTLTAMDPRAQFEADRSDEAWETVMMQLGAGIMTRDYVKMYEAQLRLTPADSLLAKAALEAQQPPVSETLSPSAQKELEDRVARWVPPRARTPSPPPRYGRAADGRKIRSPSLIRRIRADRLNREKADELASRTEAIARMDVNRKRDLPPATGDGQPSTPRQVLHIDGIDIKGVAWGDESPSARRSGIMSEMIYLPQVFGLSHMISNHNGVNAGTTMSTLEDVVRNLVDDVNVARFKIGITWNPPHRWANDRYGYKMNYSRMHVLLVDQAPSKCGMHEAFLIRTFREHAKLDNVKTGDDNRQTVSPHYVYLVTQLAPSPMGTGAGCNDMVGWKRHRLY